MIVLTAEETRKAEELTLQKDSISLLDLMERAGSAVANELKADVEGGKHLVVFAGRGGNGGDALVATRVLSQETDCKAEVFLINNENKLSPECQHNRDRLLAECPDVKFTEVVGQFNMPDLGPSDIVLDGLFGAGLSRPLSGGYAMMVKLINRSGARVVSIDVPSGLMTEDNSANYRQNIVRANLTLCIGAVKPALLGSDNQEFLGQWRLLDIGLYVPHDQLQPSYIASTLSDIRSLLKHRDPFGNKGTFGHGLLIAGQWGMAGAAILGARAAMRSGIGKLTIHSPRCNNAILQTAVPEAVIHNDEENYFFGNPERLDGYSAVAIGPGIGLKKDTALAMIKQISGAGIPVVIDADGLNLLADRLGWLRQLPQGSMITPHPREFQRLFGECLSSFKMFEKARASASEYHIYIVLKGKYTAICTPEELTYINTTGNSGMATAGTGDVLTGVLLSLLSQGYPAEDALRLGVYLHGMAGDIAASELGEEGMTASDLINCLPKAFKALRAN